MHTSRSVKKAYNGVCSVCSDDAVKSEEIRSGFSSLDDRLSWMVSSLVLIEFRWKRSHKIYICMDECMIRNKNHMIKTPLKEGYAWK